MHVLGLKLGQAEETLVRPKNHVAVLVQPDLAKGIRHRYAENSRRDATGIPGYQSSQSQKSYPHAGITQDDLSRSQLEAVIDYPYRLVWAPVCKNK